MSSQKVDLVASEAWRCRSRDNLSTIDEVVSDCTLPTPPGPTPLWRPGSIPNNWDDVCGLLKRFWKVNKHGALFLSLDKHLAYDQCGEGELVSGVHTLAGGVVQVYHRLQVLEEEEKGRKVEQEIEREDQDEETAQMTMHMEMV